MTKQTIKIIETPEDLLALYDAFNCDDEQALQEATRLLEQTESEYAYLYESE